MLNVEEWAELRRLHFVRRLSIREIQRRTGHDRKTIRRALRTDAPPRYSRPPRPSKLDPFREEVRGLLQDEPRIPAVYGTARARCTPTRAVPPVPSPPSAASSGSAGASERLTLRHAALVHDLGRVALPNTILDKRGRLNDAEWERVRLHPYYTERVPARTAPLASLAPVAGAHHARLDGSGY